MKFLFDDESFSFEALRTAGFALYGGADLGEVLVTADATTSGDEGSWHRAWKATAQRPWRHPGRLPHPGNRRLPVPCRRPASQPCPGRYFA